VLLGVFGVVTQSSSCAVALLLVASVTGGAATATAAPCPGNPDAIGVSRTITVSAKDYPRLGHMQYRDSLPLADHEVVLTFDDGPLPPYTTRVLDILAKNCVKATFFLVGRHTAANPETARLVYAAGHTIGNHSQNHSLHFHELGEARAEREFTTAGRIIQTALGPDATVAPFVRIPGLNRTRAFEAYAQNRSMVVWSSDTVADDWTPINSTQVLNRALRRLEERGRGILLLHDIQPRTVLMLPALLAELKRRNFKIVHVVPDHAVPRPQPVPADQSIAIASAVRGKLGWPRVVSAGEAVVIPASLTDAPDAVTLAAMAPDARLKSLLGKKLHRSKSAKKKDLAAPVQTAQLVKFDRFRIDGTP
jgi:peptidoglycan/xylan/chitin deacetylase (PgdA/CDA1 family)